MITGSLDFKVRGISTDTRTLISEDLFIALKGEKFDGHAFLEEALKKGAIGAIVSKNINPALSWCQESLRCKKGRDKNKIIIKVKDTLKALGDIAKIYRERFDIPVVAISGSNGKTTTKEMLSYILSKEFNTVKAKASFNNFVGVPLTLLEIKKDTEVVVLEMETNLLGGIKRLCEIAKPSVGIVTNISDTHLQFLKTRENVFKEKAELIESLPSSGIAVLNSDEPYVAKMRELVKGRRVITFGIKNKSDFRASHIKIKDTYLEFILNPVRNTKASRTDNKISNGVNDRYRVKLNTLFYGNIYNTLAVVAAAHSVFGLNLETVIAILEEFRFLPMRMELIRLKDIHPVRNKMPEATAPDTKCQGISNGVKIINDCYNANPQSMREALLTLKNIHPSGRRIAILGDMLELGQNSADFHYQLGKLCAVSKIDILITMGEFARYVAKGAKEAGILKENIFTFDDTRDTAAALSNTLKPKDVILIKGSRKMRMEEIVDTLCQK